MTTAELIKISRSLHELGDAVLDQLEDVVCHGAEIDEQNPNALELALTKLRSVQSMTSDGLLSADIDEQTAFISEALREREDVQAEEEEGWDHTFPLDWSG